MIPPSKWVLFSSIWRDVWPWVVQGCEGVFDVVGHVRGHVQGHVQGGLAARGHGVGGGWQGLVASLRARRRKLRQSGSPSGSGDPLGVVASAVFRIKCIGI
jgi:hypothetical protein